jgi:hypothetical protein
LGVVVSTELFSMLETLSAVGIAGEEEDIWVAAAQKYISSCKIKELKHFIN